MSHAVADLVHLPELVPEMPGHAPLRMACVTNSRKVKNIVEGFKDQVWRIVEMAGAEIVSEEFIPLSDATEAQIISRIETMAKRHLSEREITESPSLFNADRDEGKGDRIIYMAGGNPYIIASLWRADDLSQSARQTPSPGG